MTDPVPSSEPRQEIPVTVGAVTELAGPGPAASAPPAAPARPPVEDPGATLGIIALVCAFLAPLAGAVLGILAMQQSRRAGIQNVPALVGLIVSAVSVVLTAVATILSVVVMVIWFVVMMAVMVNAPGVGM